MNKSFIRKLALALSCLSLAFSGSSLMSRKSPVEAAAASTRFYAIVSSDMKKRNPGGFILYNGTSNVTLSLLPTADGGDGNLYYYADTTLSPSGTSTFKNNGGSTVDIYNIKNTEWGSTWDTLRFTDGIVTAVSSMSGDSTSSPLSTYVNKVVFTPAVTQYDVTLYNGPTVVGTQKATHGYAFTPTDIAVTGYSFGGWYTDAAFTTKYVPTILTAATNLYGKYTALSSYTVTLHNGPTVVESTTVYEGDTYTPTTVATQSGSYFLNWSEDESLSSAYTPRALTSNIDLYANFVSTSAVTSMRVFVTALFSWWYNDSTKTQIKLWKSSESEPSTWTTATRTTVSSVNYDYFTVSDPSYNRIAFRRLSSSGTANYNTTRTITIDFTKNLIPLITLTESTYMSSVTQSDFRLVDPLSSSLVSAIPGLECYDETATTLLTSYNALNSNETIYLNSYKVGESTYGERLAYLASVVGSSLVSSAELLALGDIVKSSNELMIIVFVSVLALSALVFFALKKKQA